MNRALLGFAFFASGASGLVFQTVWVRMLVRFLGATTPAVATVLGVFMGGRTLARRIARQPLGRPRAPAAPRLRTPRIAASP